jgi:hypothetical protein
LSRERERTKIATSQMFSAREKSPFPYNTRKKSGTDRPFTSKSFSKSYLSEGNLPIPGTLGEDFALLPKVKSLW